MRSVFGFRTILHHYLDASEPCREWQNHRIVWVGVQQRNVSLAFWTMKYHSELCKNFLTPVQNISENFYEGIKTQ